MVEINLLSWREQKQAYESRVIRQLIAAGVVTALIILLTLHVFLKEKVRRSEQTLLRMNAATSHAMMPAAIVTREYLPAALLAAILDAASKTTGSGVCYQRIARDENGWQLQGQALSSLSISSALAVLAAMPMFTNINLTELKKDTAHDYFQFVMRMPAAENQQGE